MRYRVYVREIHESVMAIDADSEEEARQLVADGDGREMTCYYLRKLDEPADFRVEAVRGV